MMHVKYSIRALVTWAMTLMTFSVLRGQPRKVDMKTLVSKLSVACHQRSGKYSTYQQHKKSVTLLILDIIFLLCLSKAKRHKKSSKRSLSFQFSENGSKVMFVSNVVTPMVVKCLK